MSGEPPSNNRNAPAGRPGGRKGSRVTAYDVARLAGVSQPTVSRAFTPGASIAQDKRDKVLEAARKLRYVPNALASNLTTARTNTIALIIGDLRNPFYAETLQAFMAQLQDRDRKVLTFSVPSSGNPDDALMDAMRYQTDGIVVTSAQMSSDIIALSEQLEVPIAMFNRSVGAAPLPSIHTDTHSGGRILAERMIAARAGTFLVVRGDPKGSTSRERVEGFCAALDSRGIPRNRIVQIDGGSTYDIARAATRDWLAANPWPDAIFGVNDIMAMGCADAVRSDHGRRIPEDVMLAGFDGVREGQYGAYALTTVRQPIERMVAHTLDILLAPDPDARKASRPPVVLQGDFIAGRTVPAPD